MAAIAISMVGYMHRLKQAGFTDQQSEVQAGELEQMFANIKQEIKQDIKQEMRAGELATKHDLDVLRLATQQDLEIQRLATQKDLEVLRLATKKDLEALRLATKGDLELAIEKLRYESLRFTVWTGVGVVVTLGSMFTGMLAKGFHWF